ncbi:MAG: hypothetical protein CME68_08410 [Halobacteriovoraceae bacterium]|nr:hypothetical protein [Halobacteriovoraceae bacterium]
MRSNFESLQEYLLNPNLSESEFKKLLLTISSNFTSHREKIEKYVLSSQMVSAYALFYIPTNYPKLFFLMNQLPIEVRETIKTCDFIDVGTGPGTYLLSFLDFVEEKLSLGQRVFGVDQSSLMLEQAEKITNGLFPDLKKSIRFQKNRKELSSELGDEKKKKMLFFGHSLNEMGVSEADKWVDDCDPHFVSFIEPGTPETFKSILAMRKIMKEKGYKVLYPCSSLDLGCPMDGTKDWCHQVLKVTHDPWVERLCQLVSKNRRVMPMIGHIYSKANQKSVVPEGVQKGTLVRVLKETKFSFQWQICLNLDEGIKRNLNHSLINVDVLKKYYSKKDQKILKKVSVGEVVFLNKVKEVSAQNWQVEIVDFKNWIKKIPS